MKLVKCSNFIPKHKFIIRKGRIYSNYFWLLSGVVILKAGIRIYEAENNIKRHTSCVWVSPTFHRRVHWPFSYPGLTVPKTERPEFILLIPTPSFSFLLSYSGTDPDHHPSTICSKLFSLIPTPFNPT